MTRQDDHHRIAALKRREPAAWRWLYDRHCRETYGLIFHLVHGDRPLAEDLRQELWLAVLDGINGYDPGRGSLRRERFHGRLACANERHRPPKLCLEPGSSRASAFLILPAFFLLPDFVRERGG